MNRAKGQSGNAEWKALWYAERDWYAKGWTERIAADHNPTPTQAPSPLSRYTDATKAAHRQYIQGWRDAEHFLERKILKAATRNMTSHEWYPRPTSNTDRICTECGAAYSPLAPSSKTCSPQCSRARHERKAAAYANRLKARRVTA